MITPDLGRILLAAFGIGLVIFVHEAGHFLAARWCKVRVDVFSLGFGPRLIGWRRGHTLYQIAVVPLGGYVRMAGELREPGVPPEPWELNAKSIGQRFFIYSGGVIMNVIFALVFFPIVLSAGVSLYEPVVGNPVKGSPAWEARVQSGTRVLSVNGRHVFDFLHIPTEVALSGGAPVAFELMPPGATESLTIDIQPAYSERDGRSFVGISPAQEHVVRVTPGGAAERAGVREGDLLLGVDDQPELLDVTEQLQRSLTNREPIRLRVEREGRELAFEIVPEPRGEERFIYGFQPLENTVGAVRPGPATAGLDLRVGDRVRRVNGHIIGRAEDVLPALLASTDPALFDVVRDGELLQVEGSALSAEQALALDSDLFLVSDTGTSRISARPGGPAHAAGVRDGDRVLRIDQRPTPDWEQLFNKAKEQAAEQATVKITIERLEADGSLGELVFRMAPVAVSTLDFGFGLPRGVYTYRTEGFVPSLKAGMDASWRLLTDAWHSLARMLSAQLSPKNLGGIITIGRVSYDWSSQGWTKLFFFLCMLSVNLAFINVLPIPVLDGGHLFFLLVEAVKGSPVSEKTLGYSQVVGLVLILTLMVYVTYQDVVRLL